MMFIVRAVCVLLLCGAAVAAELFVQAESELAQASAARSQAQQAQEQGKAVEELLTEAQRHDEAAASLFADAYREGGLSAEQLHTYGAFLLEPSPDLAVVVYTRAISGDPSDAAAHLGRLQALLAVLPYREDELLPALAQAAAQLEAPADRGTLHALWGDFYWRKNMYDLAEQEWQLALTEDDQQPQARLGLAAIAFMDADVVEAAKVLRDLGAMTPAQQATAATYLRNAARVFAQSGASFPDTADNHVAYASLLVTALGPEALGQALLPLERAVQLAPDNHEAWNFIGSLRRQAGDMQGAREAYQRSLMAKPDEPYTQRLLEELQGD